MVHEDKFNLITRNLSEVVGVEDLHSLLENNTVLKHYIGFEISGLVHLGTGLSSMLKIRDLQKAGVETTVFLADWHTWINDKLGGNHEFIKRVAIDYFQPALEVCAEIVGADPNKINFIHGTDLYRDTYNFWESVVEVSKNLTLSRVVKSTTIMGREDRDAQPFSWMIYPPMQVADIFALGVNIIHSGTDQRKIHVIAREVAQKLKLNILQDINGKQIKPIAIHHDLLLGLQKPLIWPIPENATKDIVRTQMKMSKSIPGSAIFIHDSEDEIREKINKAFCPAQEIEFNPVINWAKHIIFPLKGEVEIARDDQFGGDMRFSAIEELENAFTSGELHPMDLKNSIANILVELLKPVRMVFSKDSKIEIIDKIRTSKRR